MSDTLKQKDQINLLEACKEFTDYGKEPNLFTYPNCGWDLVQQGLVTKDKKITIAGRAALWFLDKGDDPTNSASSITVNLNLGKKGKKLDNSKKSIIIYDSVKLIKKCSECNCGDFNIINSNLVCLECNQRYNSE